MSNTPESFDPREISTIPYKCSSSRPARRRPSPDIKIPVLPSISLKEIDPRLDVRRSAHHHNPICSRDENTTPAVPFSKKHRQFEAYDVKIPMHDGRFRHQILDNDLQAKNPSESQKKIDLQSNVQATASISQTIKNLISKIWKK